MERPTVADPFGGALVTRIVLTREGAGEARAAREELAGLVQTQRELGTASAQVGESLEAGVTQPLRQLPAHGEAAGRGVHMVRTALAQLAFQATGTSGPVGKLSEGLLMFGAGSTAVLGILAGVGLIAGAFKLLTAGVRDAEEAVKSTDETFRAALAGQGSVQGANLALGAGQKTLRDLQRQLAEQQALAAPHEATRFGRGGVPLGTFMAPGSALAQQAVGELQHAIDTQQRTVDILAKAAKDAATHAAQQAADAAKRIFDAATREIIAGLERQREIFLRFPERLPGITTPLPRLFGPDKFRLSSVRDPRTGKFRYAQYDAGFPLDNEPREPTAPGQGLDALRLIGAIGGLAGSAQGGFGGVLGGLGGIASVIPGGQVLGGVLGALGGLFSLFGGGGVKIDSYSQKALDQLKKEEESKRNIIILQTVDRFGNPRDAIYEYARYANRGGSSGVTPIASGQAVTTRG